MSTASLFIVLACFARKPRPPTLACFALASLAFSFACAKWRGCEQSRLLNDNSQIPWHSGIRPSYGVRPFFVSPIECRRTKTTVITLAHHEGHRQFSEPIKIRSNNTHLTWGETVCERVKVGFGFIVLWKSGERLLSHSEGKLSHFSKALTLMSKPKVARGKLCPHKKLWQRVKVFLRRLDSGWESRVNRQSNLIFATKMYSELMKHWSTNK